MSKNSTELHSKKQAATLQSTTTLEYPTKPILQLDKEHLNLPKECVGKEQYLQIFLNAGHTLHDVQTLCPSLPHPNVVKALFGDQPVILGQETCARYRHALRQTGDDDVSLLPRIRVAGLQNTGTNALQRLLQRNLNVQSAMEDDDESTCFRVPWGKHTPPVLGVFYHPDNPCDRCSCGGETENAIATSNTEQQQHFNRRDVKDLEVDEGPGREQFLQEHQEKLRFNTQQERYFRFHSKDHPQNRNDRNSPNKRNHTTTSATLKYKHVLPIVLVRDPLFWIQSMCVHPYEYITSIRKFPCPHVVDPVTQKPYPVSRKIYPRIASEFWNHSSNNNNSHPRTTRKKARMSKGVTYQQPSLVHLWKAFYEGYLHADFPRLLIRFEDMLHHPERVWRAIVDCAYGIEDGDNNNTRAASPSIPFQYSLQPSKTDHRVNFVSALVKNSNPRWRYPELDNLDLEWIQHVLNSNETTARSVFELFHYAEPLRRDELLELSAKGYSSI